MVPERWVYRLYWLPTAAITNHHKSSGLKHQSCLTVLEASGPKSSCPSTPVPPGGASGEEAYTFPFPAARGRLHFLVCGCTTPTCFGLHTVSNSCLFLTRTLGITVGPPGNLPSQDPHLSHLCRVPFVTESNTFTASGDLGEDIWVGVLFS